MDRHIDDTIHSIGADRMDDFEKRALLDKIQEQDKLKALRENAKNSPVRAPTPQNKPAAARPAAAPAQAARPAAPAQAARPAAPAQAARPAAPAQAAVRRPMAPPQQQPQKVIKKPVQQIPAVKKESGHFIERLLLRFRSSGIMQGEYLSQRFLSLLNGKTRDRIFDLGLVTSSLAHPTDEMQAKLFTLLTNLSPNAYEYIIRLDDIHDKTLLNSLAELYTPGAPKLVKPETMATELITLFKRIYILRNYSATLEAAVVRALEYEAQAEGKSNSVLAFNIQRAKRGIDFIFNDLLDSLHIAILNIPRRYYGYGHPDLEEMLRLGPDDRIGSITEKLLHDLKNPKSEKADSPEKTQSKDKEKGQAGKKELPKIYASGYPANVQMGMAIMKSYSIDEEMEIATGRDIPVAYMGENSKMLQTVIFFEIFDREYSCMFSSNRIKTAIDYQDGERRDAHKLLEESLYSLDETRNNLKELNRITMEHHNMQSSTRLTPLQKTTSLDKLSQAQERADLQTRSHLGNALGRAEATLKLLTDAPQMVRNPEEIIHFKFSDAEKRRLEGQTIMEAIEETYGFVSAFRARLTSGDLTGSGTEIAQEMVFDMNVTKPVRRKPVEDDEDDEDDDGDKAEPRGAAQKKDGGESKTDQPAAETGTPSSAAEQKEIIAALAANPALTTGKGNQAPRTGAPPNAANQAPKPAAPAQHAGTPPVNAGLSAGAAELAAALSQKPRPAAPGAPRPAAAAGAPNAPRPAAPNAPRPAPAAAGAPNAPRPAAPGAAPNAPRPPAPGAPQKPAGG